MTKHLLRYTLLVFVALFIVGFAWLTMSTSGLQTTLYIAEKIIPGKLNTSGIAGSFSKGIHITKISYAYPPLKINIENLHLKMQLLALFAAELHINELNIEQLNIVDVPSTQVSAPITDIKWYLPLRLALHNVNIKHLVYQQNQHTTPIENLMLTGNINSNYIGLTHLQLTYNKLIYALQGDISVNPIVGALYFSVLNAQQQPQFAMSLRTMGNWQQLNLKGEITTPLNFSFNSEITSVLTNAEWKFKGIVENLNPHDLLSDLNNAAYEGTINAQGSTQRLSLNSTLTPKENLEKQDIQLQLTSTDLQNLLFNLHLQWHNVNWPLSGTPQYSSSVGDVKLIGSPKHYTYTTSINLQGDNVPVSDWQFSGAGDQNQIQLMQFKLLTLGGKIDGQGYFKWQTPLDYQLTLNASDLDPQHQWADWYGNLNFAANIRGSTHNLALQFSNLNGQLRQQTVNGKLALTITHQQLEDINANLNYGAAKFFIIAKRQPNLSIIWDIAIPDLAKLTPFGNGILETEGQISNLTTRPTIKGNVQGTNLAWLNYQASKLIAKFDIDANLTHNSNFTIESDNLKIDQLLFQTLTLNLKGNPKSFNLYGGIVVNNNVITTSAKGNYLQNKWHTIFEQLEWKTPENSSWNLAAPFKLTLEPQRLTIENFDLRTSKQSLQLNMNWLFSKAPTGQLAMNNFALENFNQFLTHNITMQGRLDLLLSNQENGEKTVLDFSAKSKAAQLLYYDTPQATVKKIVNVKQFNAQLHTNTKALTSTIEMHINDNDYLHLIFDLPNYDIRQPMVPRQTVAGELSLRFSQLDFLTFFLPNLHSVSGRLSANLKWNGTLLAPHPVGDIELKNGATKTLPANINLKNINFKLHSDSQKKVTYHLRMNSGGGSLTVTGTTDYWQEHYPTELKISGKNFLFINNNNYRIIASPNIKLTQRNLRFDLTGSINIPEALISYRTANDVVTLPSDVVVETKTTQSEGSEILSNFYATLQLNLGTNVKISLDNLATQLTGQLLLKDSPKTPTFANGELTINNGTYTAFGQILEINNGKLMYSGGPVENPGLMIKATKTIRTYVNPLANSLNSTSSTPVVTITPQEKIITVGISVTNNLNDPELTLFSDQPNLTKTDILSYLVLGYPLSQASKNQGQTLVQAASALNLGEGQSTAVLKDLKNTFELDQVGLQSSNYLNTSSNSVQQNTSLVLGKMLSPRLFISYSIGLLAPINTLTASYAINKNLSTQTSSSILGSGVDLIYSFEHN
jgi:translocation and assembly module TamB